VEAATGETTRTRGDVAFNLAGERYDVELKTCNTNFRMEGVLDLGKPLTKNLDAIITDTKKLQTCSNRRIVAACRFPIPCGDTRWTAYLDRISIGSGIPLSANRHSSNARIPLNGAACAEIVVVSFPVVTAGAGSVLVPNRPVDSGCGAPSSPSAEEKTTALHNAAQGLKD